jgi:hypothetical protein
MTKRAVLLATGFTGLALVLGGCGVSVASGGENAATHPASGIWVSNTVGADNVSGEAGPTVAFDRPSSTAPGRLPAGLVATEASIKSVVGGGCWQDAHAGNVYGAYDQLFWWQGACGDSVSPVAVELYPTVAAASSHVHHAAADALLGRFQGGAVIVDVYADAPQATLVELDRVKGLKPIAGYGS